MVCTLILGAPNILPAHPREERVGCSRWLYGLRPAGLRHPFAQHHSALFSNFKACRRILLLPVTHLLLPLLPKSKIDQVVEEKGIATTPNSFRLAIFSALTP